MSCIICGVTDGGRHHYDCPYDNNGQNKKNVMLWKASKNEAETKYVNNPKWRRNDGEGYIVMKV